MNNTKYSVFFKIDPINKNTFSSAFIYRVYLINFIYRDAFLLFSRSSQISCIGDSFCLPAGFD